MYSELHMTLGGKVIGLPLLRLKCELKLNTQYLFSSVSAQFTTLHIIAISNLAHKKKHLWGSLFKCQWHKWTYTSETGTFVPRICTCFLCLLVLRYCHDPPTPPHPMWLVSQSSVQQGHTTCWNTLSWYGHIVPPCVQKHLSPRCEKMLVFL